MSDQGPQYPYNPAGGSGYPPPGQPTPYGGSAPYGTPQQPSYGPAPQPNYGAPPPTYGTPQSSPPAYGAAPTSPGVYGTPQTSPPPAYGAPQTSPPPPYGAPQYGAQPTYGAPGFPPPTPPKSRTSLWIAIAVVVLIVVGGGVTAAVLLNQNSVTEHLASPQKIGNLTLSQDPSGSLTQPNTANDIRNEVRNPTGNIANLYVENGDLTKPVVVVAVTGTVDNPDQKITQVFQEQGAENIGNLHSVDAGNLSGTAKCGSESQNGQTLVVCVWVDPGSLGAVVCLNRDPGDAENLFRQIRNAVLTRD